MDYHPEVLSRETVFAGRKVALEVHRIRAADGREMVREVVRHHGSVAILAMPEPGKVLMERVRRYAVGEELFEIPAGTLEEGEDPAECAARELQEETGYRAGRLEPMLHLVPSPGIVSERMTIYLASDLRPGRAHLEPGEELAVLLVPIDEVLAMVRDGRITDAKTVAAVLYWHTFARKAGA